MRREKKKTNKKQTWCASYQSVSRFCVRALGKSAHRQMQTESCFEFSCSKNATCLLLLALPMPLLPLHRVQECEINYVKYSSAHPQFGSIRSTALAAILQHSDILSDRSNFTLKLLSTSVNFRGTIDCCHFTIVAYGWLAPTNAPYVRNTCAEVTAFTPTTTHPPLQSRTKSFTNTCTQSGRSEHIYSSHSFLLYHICVRVYACASFEWLSMWS